MQPLRRKSSNAANSNAMDFSQMLADLEDELNKPPAPTTAIPLAPTSAADSDSPPVSSGSSSGSTEDFHSSSSEFINSSGDEQGEEQRTILSSKTTTRKRITFARFNQTHVITPRSQHPPPQEEGDEEYHDKAGEEEEQEDSEEEEDVDMNMHSSDDQEEEEDDDDSTCAQVSYSNINPPPPQLKLPLVSTPPPSSSSSSSFIPHKLSSSDNLHSGIFAASSRPPPPPLPPTLSTTTSTTQDSSFDSENSSITDYLRISLDKPTTSSTSFDDVVNRLDRYINFKKESATNTGAPSSDNQPTHPHSHPPPLPLPLPLPLDTSFSSNASYSSNNSFSSGPTFQARKSSLTSSVPPISSNIPATSEGGVGVGGCGGAISTLLQQRRDKLDQALDRLDSNAEMKKITAKIYVSDASTFKTMVLTPFHSSDHITAEIVTTMRLPTHFEHHASTSSLTDWCLFEICNDYNIERPIRDWESVLDIMSGWDILPSSSTSASDQQQQQTRNAILLKRYPLRDSIAVKSLIGKYPTIQGWVYFEQKPGKWQKRFFFLKESILCYYKDSSSESETLFCNLSNFDSYTLLSSNMKKKMPTRYGFALRSSDPVSFFQTPTDYVKYLCVEKEERLLDWVLAVRLAKNEKAFADNPDLFADYKEDIHEKAWRRVHQKHPSSKLSSATKAPIASSSLSSSSLSTLSRKKSANEGSNEPLLNFNDASISSAMISRKHSVRTSAGTKIGGAAETSRRHHHHAAASSLRTREEEEERRRIRKERELRERRAREGGDISSSSGTAATATQPGVSSSSSRHHRSSRRDELDQQSSSLSSNQRRHHSSSSRARRNDDAEAEDDDDDDNVAIGIVAAAVKSSSRSHHSSSSRKHHPDSTSSHRHHHSSSGSTRRSNNPSSLASTSKPKSTTATTSSHSRSHRSKSSSSAAAVTASSSVKPLINMTELRVAACMKCGCNETKVYASGLCTNCYHNHYTGESGI